MKYLLISILLFLTFFGHSQDNPEPVITSSGKYVIVYSTPFSCCVDLGSFLRLYDSSSNNLIQKIQTRPGESELDDWDKAKFDSIENKVKSLLNVKKYYKMTPINKDSIRIIKHNLEHKLSVEILLKGNKYESKIFKMNSIEYDDSFCCLSEIKKGFECKIRPTITNIWTDANKKMLLLEYGISDHQANGCSKGPFFKMVGLIAKVK